MTTPVVNVRAYTVDAPPYGLVGPGEVIEVPDHVAESLLAQEANWAAPKSSKSSSKSTESSEEE